MMTENFKKGQSPTNPYKVSSQKEKFKDTCFIDIKTKGNKAEKRYLGTTTTESADDTAKVVTLVNCFA